MSDIIPLVANIAIFATPPKKPYNRAETLRQLAIWGTLPFIDPVELQALYAPRDVIRIVGRTVGRLKKMLTVVRRRGAAKSHLYDVNLHINLARAVWHEEQFLRRLLAEQGWPRYRGRTAADEINGVRADLRLIHGVA